MIRALAPVCEGLWRSGKYDLAGLREAAALGVEVVVDLRSAARQNLLAESTYRRNGVEFMRHPVDEDAPFPEPIYAATIAAISGRHALVHCWRGVHRTGAFVALLRMRVHGWDQQRAVAEMRRHGFRARDPRSALLPC